MKSNISYKTVMSVTNPKILSNGSLPFDCEFYSDNKSVTPVRPFCVLVDDEVVTEGEKRIVFESYKKCDDFIILKTIHGKLALLNLYPKLEHLGGKFQIFSTGGTILFDQIIGITTCPYAQIRRLAFVTLEDHTYDYNSRRGRYEKHQRRLFLHDFNRGVLNSGIHTNQTLFYGPDKIAKECPFEVIDVIGPFPITGRIVTPVTQNDPWWAVYCSDNLYRVFTQGTEYGAHWILNSEKTAIQAFKRFMPTFEINYFYFLTEEGQELLVHAINDYGCAERGFQSAMKSGIDDNRVSLAENGVQLFWGQKHELKFSMKKNIDLPNEYLDKKGYFKV